MALALDFGTCNSVIARKNEADEQVDMIHLDSVSRKFHYRHPSLKEEKASSIIPSLIQYGENGRTLLGSQVMDEGELDHPSTFRWLKLDILHNHNKFRRIHGKRIDFRQAANDLLTRMITFALGSLDTVEKELVLTVPVESFDHYVDWIQNAALSVFNGEIRILDEATASVLGYNRGFKDGNIYGVLDFGGGTFDVSIVKINIQSDSFQKCEVMGRAGEELGGMKVDSWMLEHLIREENLTEEDLESVGLPLLTEIENTKIAISNGEEESKITQLNDQTGTLISHTFSRSDLEKILRERGFYRVITQTIDRAISSADARFNVKKEDIQAIFMVGGSSLLLDMKERVCDHFPNARVHCEEPFEAIARGACCYLGDGIPQPLVHDYCLKSWNRSLMDYTYVPIIPKGTNYPTGGPVYKKYISSGIDGAQTLGLVIFEKSEMILPGSSVNIGSDGEVHIGKGNGEKVDKIRPLNPEDREFLYAVPPCASGDKRRFSVGFGLDQNRRLTISLKDTLEGNASYVLNRQKRKIPLPLKDYPLVKI